MFFPMGPTLKYPTVRIARIAPLHMLADETHSARQAVRALRVLPLAWPARTAARKN